MRRTGFLILAIMALVGVVQAAAAQDTPASNNQALSILVNTRTDLEILANEHIATERPAGWSGSLDVNDPQLPILIRLDLELLAARLVGVDNLPAGWFGAVPSTPYAIARDIRHDLELLADTVDGINIRPPGWAGDDPLMRCDRSTQNLVQVLERSGLFTPAVMPTEFDYCHKLAVQVGQYTEVNLLTEGAPTLANPQTQESGGGASASTAAHAGAATGLAGISLAFLDRYATKRVGTIPTTERFEPVARSRTQFSRMTLVRGTGFEVFVDYATTSITPQEFASLPDVNGFGANPFCDASWCHEPIIIPPLENRSGGRSLAATGLVSAGTNMVIHYDGDDRDGMTKVRMELCDRPTKTGQAICEAATEVILPDGSSAEPVDSVEGLPQFYVPYKYTRTSVRSRHFYTIDLWIDPPENRD